MNIPVLKTTAVPENIADLTN